MKKVLYLDYLRVLCCISVIVIHVFISACTNFASKELYQEYIAYSIRQLLHFAVPIFFMITGALFLNENKKIELKNYLKKYVLKYIIIILSFGFIFALMEQIYMKNYGISAIYNSIINVLAGRTWDHMWYLYSLIGIMTIIPIVKELIKSNNKYIYYMLVILFIPSFLYPLLNVFGYNIGVDFPLVSAYLFYCLIGHLIYEERKKRDNKSLLIGIILLSLIIIVSSYFVIYHSIEELSYFGQYDSISILLLSMSIFMYFKNKELKLKNNRIIAEISKTSFGIYIIHMLFINILYKMIKFSPFDEKTILFVIKSLLLIVIVFFSSYATTKFFQVLFRRNKEKNIEINGKIKVVHICNTFIINGISNVIQNICLNLDPEKYDVTLICGTPYEKEYYNRLINNKVKVLVISANKKKPIKYYRELLKYLGKEKYDIAHIHGNSATIIVELLVTKMIHIKKVIVHSHTTSCRHKIIHKLFKPLVNIFMDAGISCSEAAGEWLFYNNYKVVNNGFNTSDFKYNEMIRRKKRKELNVKDTDTLVGHVGRFIDVKNHEFIIKIFESIISKDNSIKLVLIGDGPNKERIENEIKEKKLTDNIIIIESTTNIKDYYSAMDLFILPSKYEGFGIVVVEAQINSLPCLISDRIPNEVVLSNNVNVLGLDNIQEWVEIILKKEYKRNHISLDSFKIYDTENMINKIDKIYSDCFNDIKNNK